MRKNLDVKRHLTISDGERELEIRRLIRNKIFLKYGRTTIMCFSVLRNRLSRRFRSEFFQGNDNAIFQFVKLSPLTLKEPWVLEQLIQWIDLGNVKKVRRLVGLHRNMMKETKRWGVIYMKVKQLIEELEKSGQKIKDGDPLPSRKRRSNIVTRAIGQIADELNLSDSMIKKIYYELDEYNRILFRLIDLT